MDFSWLVLTRLRVFQHVRYRASKRVFGSFGPGAEWRRNPAGTGINEHLIEVFLLLSYSLLLLLLAILDFSSIIPCKLIHSQFGTRFSEWVSERHNRKKNTWEKALHRKIIEDKRSSYEDKNRKFRLKAKSQILS